MANIILITTLTISLLISKNNGRKVVLPYLCVIVQVVMKVNM